ncbi:helix-turn-helix domain-containing protein [Streptomyces lichenis]|uniref:Helix-turn-helix domain-containing protein n=1 Tax=Streptomyces lichenis TaxID=2306967 RepID=A0ABT0I5Y5_9ACTN|nr:helix-turn-helix transcriptional regulator [Streptomyces lichenis]MCK8676728.1 helix-turn-helix domain-containing protein [Streptomyces lichenis]
MTAENDGEAWRAQGEPEPPEALRTFGAVLKALREEAGHTREQFEPLVRYSVSYIAKIEQGRRFPPEDLISRVRNSLGPGPARVLAAAAKGLKRKVGLASWFQAWAAIEEAAVSLYTYDCAVIPGLLQPESFLREVLRQGIPGLSQVEMDERLEGRLKRQQLLDARLDTQFSFIIEEALIERGFGGPEVTRDLLNTLLERGAQPNIEIQVMPKNAVEHQGFEGPMCLAELPDHQWLGYTEAHDTGTLITEPKTVSCMLQRYGKMRSQALSPEASRSLLEQMRGAL